jgi:hypothetical protein
MLPEAQSAINEAHKLAGDGGDVETRLPIAIEYARIQTASGHTAEAHRLLEDALAQARTSGAIGFQFDAQLALAEAEIGASTLSARNARLKSLERKAKGFLLIARKAAAEASNPSCEATRQKGLYVAVG